MPILNVEIVTKPEEHIDPDLAIQIANQSGEIFKSAPGNTWVKIQLIGSNNYAENHSISEDIFPVFVTVLKARLPARETLQAEAVQLATRIAQLCNRPPENVHIIYLPEGMDRVAFGGKLIHE